MEMITFLKRRFSSGDLQGEAADKREKEGVPGFLRFGASTSTVDQPHITQQYSATHQGPAQQYRPQDLPPGSTQHAGTHAGGYNPSGMFQAQQSQAQQAPASSGQDETSTGTVYRGKATYPSAPTSPTRGPGSFMGTSMGSIRGHISNTIMRGFSTASSTAQNITTGRLAGQKERQKVLLVIDDSQTDWCKYFKGKKILGDWEIRVEQAQFSEITMTAYSDHGCVINIYPSASRSKPIRSFRPDFVLLRQHASDANEDWQSILTGLMYAGTPCMNTLHAVVNMKNRPWLFAHLLLLRNRLGKDAFPLITQTYHTNHKEMITAPVFPTIIKVGLGHGGEGKVRADNPMVYQDIVSLLVSGNVYATTEPFVDAKCDVHIQKIGPQYKAFVRKSISGYWKSNAGSAVLEKVPMNEKFKQWIDEVARMFGGLDICSVEALQNKTGDYFVYDVNGSDMALFGESQEEDRREIAELVVQRMQSVCAPSNMPKAPSLQSMGRANGAERSVQSGFSTPTPGQSFIPASAQPTTMTSPPTLPQNQSRSPTAPVLQPTTAYPSYTGQTVGPTHSSGPMPQKPLTSPPSGPSVNQTPVFAPAQQYQQQQPMVPQQQQQHSQQQPQQQPSQQFRQPISGSSPVPASGLNAWGDQGSMSSISSSAGSVSSSFTGITSTKVDGNFPSGKSTPVGGASGPVDVGFGNASSMQDSRAGPGPQTAPFEAGFPTSRQSPFNNNDFGTSQSAWPSAGSQSVEAFAPTMGQVGGKSVDRSINQRGTFDGNDPFEQISSGKFTGPGPFANSMTSGTPSDTTANAPKRQTSATGFPNQESTVPERPFVPPRQTSLRQGGEDSDDTMKNLRKTFAGIFGDM